MHDFSIEFIQTWLVLRLLLIQFQNGLKSKSTYGLAFISDQTNKMNSTYSKEDDNIEELSIQRINQWNFGCKSELYFVFIWVDIISNIYMILLLLQDQKTVMKYEIRNANRKKRNWDQNSTSAFMFCRLLLWFMFQSNVMILLFGQMWHTESQNLFQIFFRIILSCCLCSLQLMIE